MAHKEFLELNLEKTITCLTRVLDASAMASLRAEQAQHVHALVVLAENHLTFSKSIPGRRHWRHIVSRSYYAAYIASKAVRYAADNAFSKEARDHLEIGTLPKDFPNKPRWSSLLSTFRGDRNIADYDHLAKSSELEESPNEYRRKSEQFVELVKTYLKTRGIPV
jgi:hypothetical protein